MRSTLRACTRVRNPMASEMITPKLDNIADQLRQLSPNDLETLLAKVGYNNTSVPQVQKDDQENAHCCPSEKLELPIKSDKPIDTFGLCRLIENGALAQAVRILNKYGAEDINGVSEEGWSALHWAIHVGSTTQDPADECGRVGCCEGEDVPRPSAPLVENILECLLQHNADVNLGTTEWGVTPLMFAAESGNQRYVDLLLENGADPNLCDNDGRTYQEYYEEKEKKEI